MAIPDFQTLMLPVLSRLAGQQSSTNELVAAMADHFGLTDGERVALLPSGRQAIIANRVHWALSYLGRAGLLDRVARGVYRASERGRSVLVQPPERITTAFLRQFPEFRSLRPNDSYPEAGSAATAASPAGDSEGGDSERTPEERIGDAMAIIRADLREKLLQRVRAAEPAFFEQVVIDLLVAMGYGTGKDAGEVRGKAGDGGIDGVIREDRLGLDLIYVQAKRYAADNPVGPDKIREFSGALDFTGARKGVFITTSRFTPEAARFALQLQIKRIVLIDGEGLTDLMIQHGVGVRPKGEPVVINEIDLNYFEPDEAA
jgi:restriction system protein